MTDHQNSSAGSESAGLTNIERVRLALAMADAGYEWDIELEYVEALLKAYDDLGDVAQPVVAWRMAPGDGILHGITEDSKIADLWRKSGCVIEPLTLAAQPSPAATVETTVWSMEEALSDAGAAKVNAVLAESHTGLSAATEPVTRYGEPAIPLAIKAIRAWQANKATSYTPTDILNDCGDAILAALTSTEPQAVQVPADQVARTLALSYGRDPDAMTEWTEMCDAHNRPVPIWKVYEEQAEVLLAAYSMSRPLLCAHGVKIGNTCVGCMGAATLASQLSRTGE